MLEMSSLKVILVQYGDYLQGFQLWFRPKLLIINLPNIPEAKF